MLKKIKWYGVFGLLRLIRDILYSRVLIPRSRIIRSPFYIRGWKEIDFGFRLTSGVGLRIDALGDDKLHKKISFGKDVQVNDYVHIAAIDSVIIGDHVLIASKVFISDHNHGAYAGAIHSNPMSIPIERDLYSKPVVIESNVWIGESVSIMPGVTIGEGSIIGASSVVTKDVPPYSIAVGSPCRVIKQFNFELEKWIEVIKN